MTQKEITLDQVQRAYAYADEWRRVALCTDRADRDAAEKAVRSFLEAGFNLSNSQCVWGVSPQVFDAMQESAREHPRFAGMATSIHELWEQASCFISQETLRFVRSVISVPLSNRFSNLRRVVIWDRHTLPAFCGRVYSQYDGFHIAFFLFLRDVMGVRYDDCTSARLNLWAEVSRSLGWVAAISPRTLSRSAPVCCMDRPTVQRFNAQGVVHCTDAPALMFEDGGKIWMLNGHKTDDQLVMRPEAQNPDDIRSERNAELKRIRIERFAGRDKSPAEGWKRYLKESNAKCLDRRRNGVENVEEALFATGEEIVLLCACPSTARLYALEVPNNCRDVQQAQAYLHSESKTDELGVPNVIGRS